MKDINLFIDKNNNYISKKEIFEALQYLKANHSDYLFIHSQINFGNPLLKKNELLKHLADIFLELKIANLIFPVFTFSFCNKEDFDLESSKSKMGILNEYFRKLDFSMRTKDPLMSCSLIAKDKDLFNIGNKSCGKDSIFDKLHNKENVKFLFFGNRVHNCFTYSHYIEDYLKVPYRYDKEFSGNIINKDNKTFETFILPVRYANVLAFDDDTMSKELDKFNAIERINIGDSQIEIVNEKQSFNIIKNAIENNIDFMLKHPYPRDFLDKTYIYEKKVAL
ncbi:MAG: AAC(3) family N-acetyltransferase [Helicobacteraceae bacterium]|nr:AAC(3) family N-acetyltransferase [Helicobacteraceae bacterium]